MTKSIFIKERAVGLNHLCHPYGTGCVEFSMAMHGDIDFIVHSTAYIPEASIETPKLFAIQGNRPTR